jgi:hypothetical protein
MELLRIISLRHIYNDDMYAVSTVSEVYSTLITAAYTTSNRLVLLLF